jgi:hypothetical protein
MCGKIILTNGSDPGTPLRGEAFHKLGEINQVRDPKRRAPLPHDDFGIRGDYVGPLRRNRTNGAVVDAQQKSLAGPVIALTDADELLAAERMEGMGYPDKLHRSGRKVCIPR